MGSSARDEILRGVCLYTSLRDTWFLMLSFALILALFIVLFLALFRSLSVFLSLLSAVAQCCFLASAAGSVREKKNRKGARANEKECKRTKAREREQEKGRDTCSFV